MCIASVCSPVTCHIKDLCLQLKFRVTCNDVDSDVVRHPGGGPAGVPPPVPHPRTLDAQQTGEGAAPLLHNLDPTAWPGLSHPVQHGPVQVPEHGHAGMHSVPALHCAVQLYCTSHLHHLVAATHLMDPGPRLCPKRELE